MYYISNIIRVTKSREVGWVDHEVRMGEMRHWYDILVGTPYVKGPLGRQIILKWEPVTVLLNTLMEFQVSPERLLHRVSYSYFVKKETG
jgi:hypothetical protein